MNLNVAVVGAADRGKACFASILRALGPGASATPEEGPYGRGEGVITPEQARKLMVEPGSRTNGTVRTLP